MLPGSGGELESWSGLKPARGQNRLRKGLKILNAGSMLPGSWGRWREGLGSNLQEVKTGLHCVRRRLINPNYRISAAWFWGEVEGRPGLIPAAHIEIIRGTM
jgi:hypothetical protein